ncbi:MAG: hypothetical protein IJB16_00525, partial [Clostridia bacterium]|nr:hypothetical protein [Clostridia bacterium]
MKQFFKSLSAVVLAASVFVFSAVCYGAERIPDTVDTVQQEAGEILNGFFSIGNSEAVKVSGFTNSDCGYKAKIMAFELIPVKEVTVNVAKRRYVGVGGDVFGIKLYTKGVIAVKIESVDASTGAQCPAQLAGIRCGDSITHVNGSVIINADDF